MNRFKINDESSYAKIAISKISIQNRPLNYFRAKSSNLVYELTKTASNFATALIKTNQY